MVDLILSEKKEKSKKIVLKADRMEDYFGNDYTSEEVEEVIYKLLDRWKQNGGFD